MRRPYWCTKKWQNVAQVLHNNRIKFPKEFFRNRSVHHAIWSPWRHVKTENSGIWAHGVMQRTNTDNVTFAFAACNCSVLGSNVSSCHPETGECSCRENVIGRYCDRCMQYFYNFSSGAGCSACNCDPVYSTSLQCDGNSGVCNCLPGVNGNKCSGCADQFYNLTREGEAPSVNLSFLGKWSGIFEAYKRFRW